MVEIPSSPWLVGSWIWWNKKASHDAEENKSWVWIKTKIFSWSTFGAENQVVILKSVCALLQSLERRERVNFESKQSMSVWETIQKSNSRQVLRENISDSLTELKWLATWDWMSDILWFTDYFTVLYYTDSSLTKFKVKKLFWEKWWSRSVSYSRGEHVDETGFANILTTGLPLQLHARLTSDTDLESLKTCFYC